MFRFIIEYSSSSLRDFYRPLLGINNNNIRSIYFYYEDFGKLIIILACVET